LSAERPWEIALRHLVPDRRHRQLMVMLLPVTILALGLGLYPILQSLYLGLTNYRIGGVFGTTPLRFLGVTNFEHILNDPDFISGLTTIAWVGGLVVVITYAMAYLLALLLGRAFPLRRVFRTIVLLPMAIPPLVGGQVWRYMYDPSTGAVNALLLTLHLESSAKNLPTDPVFGVFWIALVGIWLGLPFAALMVLASMQSISDDLLEAAAIDGAGRFARFRHIVFPGTRGVLAAIVPLSFAGQLLAFDAYFALSGGGSGANSAGASFMIPSIYAYFDLTSGLLGRAAATGDMLLVLILLAFFLSRYISLKSG
jgi:ABC-type sugar transport system permease subunit